MHLFCPTCQVAFTGLTRCANCGERLVTPAEYHTAAADSSDQPNEPVRPSVFGRVLLGCLVTAGLFFGLHEWAKTLFDWLPMSIGWQQQGGAVLTVVLRLLAVLAGGLLSGAGRPHGSATGATVGLVCGGLFLFVDVTAPVDVGLMDGLLVAAITALGAAAGHVGGYVWPPVLDLPDPLPDPRGSSLARLVEEEKERRKGRPTAFAKAVVAAAVVVSGLGVVDLVRVKIKTVTAGVVNMGGAGQAPVVDLELAVLLLVGAGIWAGSNTGAGTRHGILMGVFAGMGGVALCGRFDAIPLVTEGLHRVLDLGIDDINDQMVKARLFAAILLGCTFGGWLGGQMFPPIMQRKRLRAFD